MSCGQCIRKVLKAAEPFTKHTLKLTHAHTHTVTYTGTQPHRAPYTAIALTRRDKGTFSQTHIGTYSQGHKDTPSHTGPVWPALTLRYACPAKAPEQTDVPQETQRNLTSTRSHSQ